MKLSLNRYWDLVVVFDSSLSNPNGDYNNDNKPRILPDGKSYMSDVCLKRKYRDTLSKVYEQLLLIEKDCNLIDKTTKNTKKEVRDEILSKYIDARLFGFMYPEKRRVLNELTNKYEDIDISTSGWGPIQVIMPISINSIDEVSTPIVKSTNKKVKQNNEENEELDFTSYKKGKKKSDTMGEKNSLLYGIYISNISYCPINNIKFSNGQHSLTQEDVDLFAKCTNELFDTDQSSGRKLNRRWIFQVEYLNKNPSKNAPECVKILQKECTEGKSFEDFYYKIDEQRLIKYNCRIYVYDDIGNLIEVVGVPLVADDASG